ncbi:ABC transporter ATP-binding protein [Clostridium manihotivorum]|uniref:Bacitracin ABC transporter ATP-binding protein n=1 Tax=Clostridium manihotivorum TaxID=2320868 RepID=A0A410DWF6_9CLOT|nr:ABC transporter ATP-binding protein [Clostridium manihotivorum]QAA33415.1 bacitracin ABC transporter ATP-binding protein [Clostridium manihotivorum]
MNEIILRLNHVTKSYKNIKVLNDISMTIKRGQIYGLIGLNGAGKTTLLKLITGISMKDGGELELFGKSEKTEIERERRKLGVIIEKPALYENKSIYENMHINRMQKGIPGEGAIDKILNTLDLTELKDKKVKTLSIGGKQRVAIAMALLGDPEFLILDEPINGLDPMKVIEIRELFKKLNREYGTTILISSHILGELYQLANYYGILYKGRLVEQLTIEELNEKCKRLVHIKVDNSAKASVVLNKALNTSNYDILPDNIINLYDYVDDTGRVNETLVKSGIIVEQIMPKSEDLESYFAKVIGREENV